jgi:ATP-dependent DNA helicase RecG
VNSNNNQKHCNYAAQCAVNYIWMNNSGLNNTQKQIIILIQSNKYITQLEMSEQLNKTVRTIQRNMRALQENELIYRVGSDTSGYWELSDLEPDTNER